MSHITKWLERRSVEDEKAEALAQELNAHQLTAKLLLQRGIEDAKAAEKFLSPSLHDIPSPFEMKGMQKACARLVQAIVEGERIVVYGDYDVDGVTSTSLLMLFLREVGVREEKLNFFIPNRMKHGYGLQDACFPEILEMGCDLLVTVDCGITSLTEIESLNGEGVDCIILDHHLPSEGGLPKAFAILNPHQEGCPYPDKHLAAVGVAYQMLIGLRSALRDHGYFNYHPEPNLLKYIDLVALGTVADIVPLVGVNRILVAHGLKQMKKTKWPGLEALFKVSRTNQEKLNTGTLGFQLGPRINAAGRLKDASLGVRLLCSDDLKEALHLAEYLDHENQARRELQEVMFEQARAQLFQQEGWRARNAIVLAHEEWHPGVIGIVASKLVEEFHRPTVMIAIDPKTKIGKGSCRSIPGFHLRDGLTACSEHLIQYGGHAAAAGLTIEADKVDALRGALCEHVDEVLTEEDFRPQLSYDAELPTQFISEPLVTDLARLEPHGMGNPKPVLVDHDVAVLDQNTTRDGRHLQLIIEAPPYRSLKAIAFGKAGLFPLPDRVGIAYVPQLDEYRGRRRLQLNIKAIRKDEEESPAPTQDE